MIAAPESSPFDQLVRRFYPASRLIRARNLVGGISAQVTALDIEGSDDAYQTVVVRLHGELDRRNNPQVATVEFNLLRLLESTGIPAPKAYHLDTSCEIFPIPYLVIEYVEGSGDYSALDPSRVIEQLVAHLAGIHQIQESTHDLSFLRKQADIDARRLRERPAQLDESLQEGAIRAALERTEPRAHSPLALLHGDYWLGNIFWQDGKLAAILDWEDAAVGDPLYDLGKSRLEILWQFGVKGMEAYTRQYVALTNPDLSTLAYYDLHAALRPAGRLHTWGLDPAVEQHMREGHRWFVAQALENLSGR